MYKFRLIYILLFCFVATKPISDVISRYDNESPKLIYIYDLKKNQLVLKEQQHFYKNGQLKSKGVFKNNSWKWSYYSKSGESVEPPILSPLIEDVIALGNTTIDKLEKVEDKAGLIALYKDTVSEVADLVPDGLVALKGFIDQEMDGKLDPTKLDPEFQEMMMKEYEDVVNEGTKLSSRFGTLDGNKELSKKLTSLIDNLTESEQQELITFTIKVVTNMVEDIANDKDALATLNMLAKVQAPDAKDVTKEELLKQLADFNKEMKDIGGINQLFNSLY